MFGGRISSRVFSCSLLVLFLASLAWSQPMTSGELLKRLEKVESREDRLAVIDQLQAIHLPEIARESFRAAKQNRMHGDIRNLMKVLELGTYVEGSSREGTPAVETARKIKSSPLYRGAEQEKESNWLSRAFEAVSLTVGRTKKNQRAHPLRPPGSGSFTRCGACSAWPRRFSSCSQLVTSFSSAA